MLECRGALWLMPDGLTPCLDATPIGLSWWTFLNSDTSRADFITLESIHRNYTLRLVRGML